MLRTKLKSYIQLHINRRGVIDYESMHTSSLYVSLSKKYKVKDVQAIKIEPFVCTSESFKDMY